MISTESGADENDEDGRNTQAHTTVIVITGIAVNGNGGGASVLILLARPEDSTESVYKGRHLENDNILGNRDTRSDT